jgi:hypothetical protein
VAATAAVAAGSVAVGITSDCPNTAAIEDGAADPQVGYTPCGTTARGSRHHPLPLLLLSLNNGFHRPLLINGSTHQVIVGYIGVLHQLVLKLDDQPCMVEVDFLLIHVNVV